MYPTHTIHVDFCKYGGLDYIVLVDRLTGYIRAEQTANQGTDSAIKVIQNWSLLFGFPLRVISDGGRVQKRLQKKIEKPQCKTQTFLRILSTIKQSC